MKTITYVKGTDLIKLPENYLPTKTILGRDDLSQLKPYLSHFMIMNAHDLKNGKLYIHDNGPRSSFKLDSQGALAHQALLTLHKACEFFITNKVTVPEFRGKENPILQHRVIHFEIEEELMIVKYITLGASNHFNAAMLEIRHFYPNVSLDDEEKGEEVEEDVEDIGNINAGLLQEELDELDESLEVLDRLAIDVSPASTQEKE